MRILRSNELAAAAAHKDALQGYPQMRVKIL
jgi:hypothetical protein